MIIDIALGIVLGAFILRLLPLLLTISAVALALCAVGALLTFAVFLALSNEWVATRAVVVGVPIGTMIVGQVLAKALSSRTVFSKEEVEISLLICAVVCTAMVALFILVQSGIDPPLESIVRFVVLPALFFWCLALLAALAARLHRISQSRARPDT